MGVQEVRDWLSVNKLKAIGMRIGLRV